MPKEVVPQYPSFSLVVSERQRLLLNGRSTSETVDHPSARSVDETKKDSVAMDVDQGLKEGLSVAYKPSIAISIVSEEEEGVTVAEAVEAIINPTTQAGADGSPFTLLIPRSHISAVVKGLKEYLHVQSQKLRKVSKVSRRSKRVPVMHRPRAPLKRSFSLP